MRRPTRPSLWGLFIVWAVLCVTSTTFAAGDPVAPPPKVLAPIHQDTPLVVGVEPGAPYVIQGEDGSWSGLAIDMWKTVAAENNLPYVFVARDENKPFLEELSKFDVYLVLSVRLRNEEQRDLTHAYINDAFAIGVRDEKESTFDAAKKLFSVRFFKALGILGLIIICMGVIVWWIERNNIPDEFGGHPSRGIVAGVVWTIEALAGKARSLSRTPRARAFNIVWTLATVVLISGVTAKLSAELTVSQLESRISGPDDLHKFKVGTTGSLAGDYLIARGIRHTNYSTERQLFDALLSHEVDAIVHPQNPLKYYERNIFPGRIRVLPVTFHRFGFAMALRPGSPLLSHINRTLLKEVQSDTWKRAQMDLLGASD